MNLTNCTVLVTGASGGIGAGTARAISRRGATVGILARRADAIERVVSEIREAGGAAIALVADVTRWEQVHASVHSLVEQTGRLDAVINNAGHLGPRLPFEQYGVDALRVALEVNVIGTYVVTSCALPHMRARPQSAVLNISSYLGRHGLPNCAGYIAAKFGVEGLTAALAAEVEGSGLIVASLAPGMVATDMLASYLGTTALDEYIGPDEAGEAIAELLGALGPEHHGRQLDIDAWLGLSTSHATSAEA